MQFIDVVVYCDQHLNDVYQLQLDNLALELDQVKTEMSSFVQKSVYDVLHKHPYLAKSKTFASFTPGNEKIEFTFNKKAITNSEYDGNTSVTFGIAASWSLKPFYTMAFGTKVQLEMPVGEDFEFDESHMVSRLFIDREEAQSAQQVKAAIASDNALYREEQAAANVKKAEKRKKRKKSGGDLFLDSIQRPPTSSQRVLGIDMEAAEGDADDEVAAQFDEGSASPARTSSFHRDREQTSTPTPFDPDSGVCESYNKHSSSAASSGGNVNLLDFSATPCSSQPEKFAFRRGVAKRVVNDDDDDDSVDASVSGKKKTNKPKERPPISLTDCKKSARKSFVTSCVQVPELKAYIQQQIDLNIDRMEEALANAPPCGKREFLLWAKKENSNADDELVDFIISYVRSDVEFQIELEQRLIRFILRKHELHHLTTCSDLSPGQYVVCANLVDISNTLKKQIMTALTAQQELERAELEKICKQRIKSYEESLVRDKSADSTVNKNELMELYKAEVSKELNLTIADNLKRNGTMSKSINVSITRVLTRVVVTWARVTENCDQIPQELLAMYAAISNAPGFRSVRDKENREMREVELVECIKKSMHDKKQMHNLVVQLVNKDARANLVENYNEENAAKKSKAKASSSDLSAKTSSEKTSSEKTSSDKTSSDKMQQGVDSSARGAMDKFIVSDPFFSSSFLAYSSTATPLSVVKSHVECMEKTFRNCFKPLAVIEKFDELMKIAMRVAGFGQSHSVYLSFDASGAKLENYVARFLLLKFCLSRLLAREDSEVDGPGLRVAFEADKASKLVACTFCHKHKAEDRLTIKPDGYCFYRVVFQLWRRHKSDYKLTLADMVDNDRRVNSSAISTPENEEFKKFLLTFEENICALDGSEDKFQLADRNAMTEAFELAAAYSSVKPGKNICEEDWGNAAWLKFISFNISNFTVVKKDEMFLSRRLYQQVEVGDQWSLMQRPGLCDPKKHGFLLCDIVRAVQEPNFCSYSDSHFFLVDSPSAGEVNASTNIALEIALTNMLGTLALMKEDVNIVADDVNKMIQWLESGGVGSLHHQVRDVNLEYFKREVARKNPGVNQASSSVIDLSFDDDETVDLDKSSDDIVIEMLTKLVR